MPDLQPFQALRYDPARSGGDLSDLIAPPYDVLNQSDKTALLEKNAHNIVAVDLPHVPPKAAAPAEVYARSAMLLAAWRAEGVLIHESKPALYVYHQRFTHDGREHTRRMFIARVRLTPFAEGHVVPHEQTFGGPKEDRLALMKATRCQLSPIFGLYTDPQNEVGRLFGQIVSRDPDATAELGGIENRLWVDTDPKLASQVGDIMAGRKIYIADGHHRYSTALMYRDHLVSELGTDLPPDHPAQYVMFVLASMDDPGCLILPYYRVLGGLDADALRALWSDGTAAAAPDKADVTLWDGTSGKETPLGFTRREVLRTLEPGQVDPWYALDYAYLHRYLLEELLGDQDMNVHYVHSLDDARVTARREKGVALMMKPTPMAHLRAVGEVGGLMPQKSTYFYPKLATGLTLYPLEEE